MKLTLKDFQEITVAQLVALVEQASGEVAKLANEQALILSAPTGSGKTVIATAVMERMLLGDDEHEPDPEATFLWLTDQPDLNTQTRHKLETGSSAFDDDNLVTVEAASFDQGVFDTGKVYFLNTQKLGKNSGLTAYGDTRRYLIWETIANTVAERPESFWLIIDEAHRGMQQTKKNGNGNGAQSLVQRLIKGVPEENIPAVPLILGISATPERFNKLLEGTTRIRRPVEVKPEDVRSSGLLKDAITLYHTDEEQPSDVTLLGAAAARTKEYAESWDQYAKKEEAAEVRPVLVVQVEDGTKKQLTKTDLEQALAVVEDNLGDLDPGEIGHCFQEGGTVTAGARDIPHVAPSDIEDDPNLRVVLFKMALTTGWDCPRAEVMMSFRKARDDTLIAQLVGRMVRTPLARHVTGSDLLNSVCLYLPYYDRKALDEVIEKLSQPDPDNGLPGTHVRRGNELATLKRDKKLAKVFLAADGLPHYKVERVSKQSGVRRLMRLGRHLAWDDIDKNALDVFNEACLDALEGARVKRADNEDFKRRYDETGRIDIRAKTIVTGTTEMTAEERAKLPIVEANVEHAFDETGRKLGGGLHLGYLKRRAAAKGAPAPTVIKRELFALLQDPAVAKEIERKANKLCDDTLTKHRTTWTALSDERRQEYRRLHRVAASPEPEPWSLPQSIEGPKKGDAYERHLFVKDDGSYTCKLNDWEQAVVAEELKNKDVFAWLRNDPRKDWAFSLPYVLGGEDRPMYPDFLFFRREGKRIACDILEPHSLSWADSAAKAKGLAEFANKHGEEFGRIELIAKTTGKNFKRLTLHDPETLQEVRGVATNDHLRQLVERS